MTVHDARLQILQRRKREIETKWRELQEDVAHWNRLHPDEQPIVIEPITDAEIEAIKLALKQTWDILVECVGANEANRETFYRAWPFDEFRFQGALGFGGKIRNADGIFQVGCYPEDRNAKRDEIISVTNERLAGVSIND